MQDRQLYIPNRSLTQLSGCTTVPACTPQRLCDPGRLQKRLSVTVHHCERAADGGGRHAELGPAVRWRVWEHCEGMREGTVPAMVAVGGPIA